MIKIRKAASHDIDVLARIQIAGWQNAYAHIFPVLQLNQLSQLEWQQMWKERLSSGHCRVLLLEKDNEVHGFVAFGPYREGDKLDDNKCEIYALYLDPLQKGKGYGRILCEAACEHLKKDGFVEVVLWTLEQNHDAQRFYETLGFKQTAAIKTFTLLDVVVNEIQYIKYL